MWLDLATFWQLYVLQLKSTMLGYEAGKYATNATSKPTINQSTADSIVLSNGVVATCVATDGSSSNL